MSKIISYPSLVNDELLILVYYELYDTPMEDETAIDVVQKNRGVENIELFHPNKSEFIICAVDSVGGIRNIHHI